MGKVAVHYGWIPLILYVGTNGRRDEANEAGYTQSSPRPALWKY
jgi:hypothetical protein